MHQVTPGSACKQSWFLRGVPGATHCPTHLHELLGEASLLASLGVPEHPLGSSRVFQGCDPHPGPLHFWIDPPGPPREGGSGFRAAGAVR